MLSNKLFGVVVVIASVLVLATNATPLDDYVAKADPSYNWVDTGKRFHGPGYVGYILNMTSQTWLSTADVDRSVWWHYVVVVIPKDVKFKDTGTVYITGGSNTDSAPTGTGEDELLCIAFALFDKCVCTVLFQIPNQPLVFTGDGGRRRSEDAAIAFTWNHFMIVNSSQPEWLLRLPMTKAVVRAMDTTTDFIKKQTGESIDKFIVAGASKRGWTTWTTGAVDKRVIAIIPIVMDALNFHTNVHHFWRAFGGWTFAFKDYYEMNFTAEIDLPSLGLMTDVIDPYVYRDRLTMPKLVIDSCGDEFFMPDDNWYWWNDMTGEIHLLMVQDAEHSLVTGLPEVVTAATSFAYGVLSNTARPSMTWTFGKTFAGGNITVVTSETPTKIVARFADTLDNVRRDWRLITGQNPCPTIEISGACPHPVLWHADEVFSIAPNTYVAAFDARPDRWRAFFIEVEFRGDTEVPYVFTTQINIIPDTFPFPDCQGAACKGTLL